jgi:hypothetical protein
MKRYSFYIDDSAADWWQYHFDDGLLRNDVAWRSWRIALQKQLSQQQLNGIACSICGVHVDTACRTVVLGGYRLVYCQTACQSPLQREIGATIATLETQAPQA